MYTQSVLDRRIFTVFPINMLFNIYLREQPMPFTPIFAAVILKTIFLP